MDFRVLDDNARHRAVAGVGETLMQAIRGVVPVLPVSLVATVVARETRPLAEIELKARAFELARRLEANGAHVYVPRSDLDYAIGVGLRMLTLRHVVVERDGLYAADDAQRALLVYYANAIAPLVDVLK